MQVDVARYLLFSAAQPTATASASSHQTVPLDAQLHALQLACCLQAEADQLPPPGTSHLLSSLQADCAKLLAAAGASATAGEARCAALRCAAHATTSAAAV
jgi:hypothetical protein